MSKSGWIVFFVRGFLPTMYLEERNKYTIHTDKAKRFKTKKAADRALAADLMVDVKRGTVDNKLEGYVKYINKSESI